MLRGCLRKAGKPCLSGVYYDVTYDAICVYLELQLILHNRAGDMPVTFKQSDT